MVRTLCLVLLCGSALALESSELPRRSYLGASLTAPEDVVTVLSVTPDGPAAAAGLQADDRVLAIGGTRIEGENAIPRALSLLRATPANENVELLVQRGDETFDQRVRLAAFPTETYDDFDTVYGAVEVADHAQRTILTLPDGAGPHPVVYYVQGVGCSSIERMLRPQTPLAQFVAGLTRAGYATFRVEKPGIGDSTGPPCESIGFHDEAAGYLAGLRALKRDPRIDPERIVLFGHSMGGTWAPLMAKEEPVAGIIAYGLIGSPLERYFHENNARQFALNGMPEPMMERQLGQVDRFIELFFRQRMTPGEALEADPTLRSFFALRNSDATHFHGRHYTFWHELADLNPPSYWAGITAPTLVLWGAADIAATRQDHLGVVDTLTASGNSNARFLEIPGIDHGWFAVDSMEASIALRGQAKFNPAITDVVSDWIAGEIVPK